MQAVQEMHFRTSTFRTSLRLMAPMGQICAQAPQLVQCLLGVGCSGKRSGGLGGNREERDGGGGGLKKRLTDSINTYFAPLRARRTELAADPGLVDEVLARGNARANEIAETTLTQVRERMGMTYP